MEGAGMKRGLSTRARLERLEETLKNGTTYHRQAIAEMCDCNDGARYSMSGVGRRGFCKIGRADIWQRVDRRCAAAPSPRINRESSGGVIEVKSGTGKAVETMSKSSTRTRLERLEAAVATKTTPPYRQAFIEAGSCDLDGGHSRRPDPPPARRLPQPAVPVPPRGARFSREEIATDIAE